MRPQPETEPPSPHPNALLGPKAVLFHIIPSAHFDPFTKVPGHSRPLSFMLQSSGANVTSFFHRHLLWHHQTSFSAILSTSGLSIKSNIVGSIVQNCHSWQAPIYFQPGMGLWLSTHLQTRGNRHPSASSE
jgi:hypothetical protein